MKSHLYWFSLEIDLLCSYDCGDYQYEDAYRHCFNIARNYEWLESRK